MVNIVICGTPGTGKSTLIERMKSEKLPADVDFINLSKHAIENGLTSGFDEELDTHEVDEDKLEESLRPRLEDVKKINVLECIHADMIDPSLIDLVFVCRTNNTQLYDRLSSRNYNERKLSENLQAEIFQTILDEARETYEGESKVYELVNDSLEDLEKNVDVIVNKVKELRIDKGSCE